MYVQIMLSSVEVFWRSPLGENCSLGYPCAPFVFCPLVNLVISHFCFKGRNKVLIESVLGWLVGRFLTSR